MSKAVKQLIITGIMIVFLALILMNNLKGISKNRPGKPGAAQQATGSLLSSAVNIPADKKIIISQKKRAESLDWARDPFVYVETDQDKSYRSGILTLKGISLGKDKIGFAFINNEIVKIDDIIGGYQVLQIDKDKVLLKKGGQSFYLALPEE
ncbi:hypothetical protein ACFL4C_00065 [Candidatus Omnitrophota bacterium]